MHTVVPAPGALVWIRRQRWRVERAERDGHVVRLDVADRDRRLSFLTPFDRLMRVVLPKRPRRVTPRRAAAALHGLVARGGSFRLPWSLLDAQVDVLPYQLEPALAFRDGVRRVLIADEVGLGKTIQAGLVIAELQRERSVRVLIVVPAGLTDQWRRELESRLGLATQTAHGGGLTDAVREGRRNSNPWARAGIFLVSADYLKQPHVLETLPPVPWDLVVIDEAHDACGESDRHAACAATARLGRRVLLLTATPHGGDNVRFERLQNLGALRALDDDLVTFRRTRHDVGLRETRRVRWHRVRPSDAERRVLDALSGYEAATMRAAGRERADAALLLLLIFRKRALSTMAALAVTVARRLSVIQDGDLSGSGPWAQPRLDFGDAEDDMNDAEHVALTAQTGLGAGEERAWLGRIKLLADAALADESRIARIARLAARTREPFIVFTEFRHSLAPVERRLAQYRIVTSLHGGQTPAERRGNLARFLSGAASVLVTTDVAGQGLNLQARARWVIALELPWNPTRLEQRIGRVDRLGQTRAVHATLLVARHEAEEGLLARLAARAIAARRALGDDVLRDVAPPQPLELQRGPFGAQEDPAGPRPPLASRSSVAWRRAARAAARQILARRALARQWRGPLEIRGRPLWTCTRRRSPHTPGPSSEPACLFVVSVTLRSAAGQTVERALFGLRVPAAWRRQAGDIAAGLLAQPELAMRLAARRRRILRALTARARVRLLVDQAIAAALRDASGPERQPGLFAPPRTWRSAAADLGALALEIDRHAHDCRLSAEAEYAAPVAEVVVCPRR